jgi:CHAT domain-containing protein
LISQGVNDSTSLYATYNNLGIFYKQFGNLIESELFFNKALAYDNDKMDEEQKSRLYNNYADMLFATQKYQEAITFFKESRAINSNWDNRDNFLPFLNMESTHLALFLKLNDNTQLKKSSLYLDSAGMVLNAHFDSLHVNYVHFLIAEGYLLFYQKHANEAAESLQNGLELLNKYHPDELGLKLRALQAIGTIALERKDYRGAMPIQNEILNLLPDLFPGKNLPAVMAYNYLGRCYLGMEDYDSANFYFRKSIEQNLFEKDHIIQDSDILPDYFYPYQQISTLYFLALSHYHGSGTSVKSLDTALVFAQQAIALLDNTIQLKENTDDQLAIHNSATELFDLTYHILFTRYQHDPTAENLNQLLTIAEKYKSRILLETFENQRVNRFARVSSELIDLEKELVAHQANLVKQLSQELAYGEYANNDLISEYNQSINQTNRQLSDYMDSIRLNFTDYYNIRFNNRVINAEELRKSVLSKSTALLEYSFVEDSLYLIVITPDDHHVIRLAIEGMESLIAIRNLITIGKRNRFMDMSEELYDILIKPAEPVLKNSKIDQLVIIPDNYLSYIPFEVFMKNGEFLTDSYTISYAYSSTLLWQQLNRLRPQDQTNTFLGIAPTFESAQGVVAQNRGIRFSSETRFTHDQLELEPLKYTEQEVESIAKEVGRRGYTYSVLVGEQADEQTLKSQDLSNYDIIHFASHSFPNFSNPSYSGIALTRNHGSTEDDILFGDEIYSLNLNADLVTLSACETGLGKLYNGEGIIGLTRGFLYAGANNLIVSLWKVDDESSAYFMENFYRHYNKTGDLARSLTHTKNKMIQSAKYSHPYFWAPFVLIGK